MHHYFYKMLHFLPQFTHLSLICHLILEYTKVYLTDRTQEDRISLISLLKDIATSNINPRVIIPIIGLILELGLEDD